MDLNRIDSRNFIRFDRLLIGPFDPRFEVGRFHRGVVAMAVLLSNKIRHWKTEFDSISLRAKLVIDVHFPFAEFGPVWSGFDPV